MLPRVYVDKRTDEIARDFGQAFSLQLIDLAPKQWHGPLLSAYGIHLVYLGSREGASQPPLERLRARVANDWLVEQRQAADERIYQQLRARYRISVLSEPTGEQ